MQDPYLQRLRDAKLLSAEPCVSLDCYHARCNSCFDLDVLGFRRQHCNRDYCERKKTPLWLLVARTLSPSLPVVETFGLVGLAGPQKGAGAEVKDDQRSVGRVAITREDGGKDDPEDIMGDPLWDYGL